MMTKQELLHRFRDLEFKHNKTISQLFAITNSVNRTVDEFRRGLTDKDEHLLRVYRALLGKGGADIALLMEIYSYCSQGLRHGAEFDPDPAVRQFCAEALERAQPEVEQMHKMIERMLEKHANGNGQATYLTS
jgi:hypothetical protein